jgi:DNA-binding IclR family transcriptional regulator
MSAQEDPEWRKYRAPALEKGLDVLELLARHRRPLTLSQLSADLGRSTSELFRMVQVLEFRGFIEATDEGFQLTNRLFALGMSHAPIRGLTEAAAEEMQALAAETFHACHLTVRSRTEIVVILRVESPGELGYAVRVGHRAPVIEATSGLLLFGLAGARAQAALRAELEAEHGAERVAEFVPSAQAAASEGFVVRPSRFVSAVTDLSVAVMGPGGVLATLNIPFVEQRRPSCDQETALSKLREAARRISRAIGA